MHGGYDLRFENVRKSETSERMRELGLFFCLILAQVHTRLSSYNEEAPLAVLPCLVYSKQT